jgi:hypothetical protein
MGWLPIAPAATSPLIGVIMKKQIRQAKKRAEKFKDFGKPAELRRASNSLSAQMEVTAGLLLFMLRDKLKSPVRS